MAAHKFTKQQLKQDSFVDTTRRLMDYGQRHATVIGIVLVAVIVLLVGGTYLETSRENAAREASALLYEGQVLLAQGDHVGAMGPLQDCIDLHGGTEFAPTARVSLIQAHLRVGDAQTALALVDEFKNEVPAGAPAHEDLAVLGAHAVAGTGDFKAAADALAATIDEETADQIRYQRRVTQTEWLQAAGLHGEAVRVLEELDAAVKSGDLDAMVGNDLANRLGVARALAR